MSKNQNKAQVIKNILLRAISKIGIGGFILIILFVIVVNLPEVQSFLVKQVTTYIAEKAGHTSSVEKVKVSWFDTIELYDLKIYDKQNNTMVRADRIKLDFSLFHLFDKSSINIDDAILDSARVTMTRNAPEEEFNFTYFIDRIKEEFSPDQPRKNPRKLLISNVKLNNSTFYFDNTGRDSSSNSFDHNHFILENLNGNLDKFTVLPGNIFFVADKLHCYDSATNLTVEQLTVDYRYTRQAMIFQNMHLVIGNSVIDNSMIFNYDNPQSLKDFVKNVTITTNIKKSLVKISDLGNFVPSIKEHNEYFRLRGYFEGEVSRFNTSNVVLEFGRSSRIEGYFNMYGLPNFSETFINANVTNASVNVNDLSPFVKQQDVERIQKFGRINFDGRFSGFPYDFVADGYFETAIGNFDSDINLKINQQNRDASQYSGRLATENLNLGLLFEDTTKFQTVAFEGKIDGAGFTKQSADVELKANFSKLGYNGYNYRDISTDARLTNELFEGNLTINDPNLKFQGKMSIDYTGSRDSVAIRANLDTANLLALKLTEKETFIRSGLDMNIQGLQSDQLLGNASFNDLFVRYEGRELSLEKFEFLSERDSLGRTFNVNSSLVNARIFGDFTLLEFGRDLGTLLYEYWLNIKNDHGKLSEYYANKKVDPKSYYYLDYEINLIDLNPLIQLFEPTMAFSEDGTITGSFTGGYTSVLEINADVEKIDYDKITFRDNTLNLTTSNFADTSMIDAEANLHSAHQFNNNKVKSKDLNVNISWHEKLIDFQAQIDEYKEDNYARLNGKMWLLPDTTLIQLEPSELKAVGNIWKFSEDNRIELTKNHYEVNNMKLYQKDQSITLNGAISQNENENLFLSIDNFDISNLSPLLSRELEGLANGYIDIRDYFQGKIINSKLNLKGLFLDGFEIGDITSKYIYQSDSNRFKTDLSLTHRNKKTIDLTGYIQPWQKKQQLALEASFADANLTILEPFYSEIISDLKGDVYGNCRITGKILKPVINGTGNVKNGEVRMDYQNTRYTFNGEVGFDNEIITFRNINIWDEELHAGNLQGTIQHQNFKNLNYNFTGSFDNFQVLNTTSEMNDLFYGTAYASGDLRIYGKGKNVNFKAQATSNKNTKIYIPLDEGDEIAQEEFIQFVAPKDTVSVEVDYLTSKESEDNTIQSTLNFDFDLDINEDAYIEIIFDRTAGDIIRGRGNGDLNLYASTDGDFEIYGDYNITDGGYNFTMYNIINKEFSILPGSSISWNGDPYGATLDIDATYRQLASLTPILNRNISEDVEQRPELSRKYPAYVHLYIDGELLSPKIDFDIKIEDYPENTPVGGISLQNYVTAFYNRLRNDEQEMKKQVFSLIVLKNFSPETEFNYSGALENSVSELISNQLSYWISQVDENLVIDFDVDLSTMSDEAFNTFQMRLSYSFLDGRLKVTRDGAFSSDPVYNSTATIIGDWTVEYLLTEDGKLRAKMYNKTNYYDNTANLNRTSTSAGFSLMHTQSFDELFERIKEKREEKRKEKDEEQNSENEAITKEEELMGGEVIR